LNKTQDIGNGKRTKLEVYFIEKCLEPKFEVTMKNMQNKLKKNFTRKNSVSPKMSPGSDRYVSYTFIFKYYSEIIIRNSFLLIIGNKLTLNSQSHLEIFAKC